MEVLLNVLSLPSGNGGESDEIILGKLSIARDCKLGRMKGKGVKTCRTAWDGESTTKFGTPRGKWRNAREGGDGNSREPIAMGGAEVVNSPKGILSEVRKMQKRGGPEKKRLGGIRTRAREHLRLYRN